MPRTACGGVGGWQDGLGFDASLEPLVEALDRVGCPRAFPSACRQACESEEAIAGFLETSGNRGVLEPPLANEGLSPRRNLVVRGGIDHLGVVGGDLVMKALGRMRQQVAMFANRAPLDRHAVPDRRNGLLQSRRVASIGGSELGLAISTSHREAEPLLVKPAGILLRMGITPQ
jgi:hypothetical protein